MARDCTAAAAPTHAPFHRHTQSFDELNVLERELVEGKIVLYNVPFIDPLFSNDTDMFHHYSRVAKYRVNGAIEAAKV